MATARHDPVETQRPPAFTAAPGLAMGGRLRIVLRELRAEFLPASMLPVFVGTSLAFYRTAQWHWPLFLWSLVGVAALHAGANVFNDYCDDRSGNDACNTDFVRPFTGGSRLIQEKQISARQVLGLAVGLIAAGVGVGLYLAARTGPLVLWLGLIAVAGGVAYSAPFLNLAGRGLGEAVVGILFGVLPVMGAYYVQTLTLTYEAFVLSLPLALLIAAVLFINQFQDHDADRRTGKRNWVVRLGRRRSAWVYAGLMVSWGLVLVAGIVTGFLPGLLALALLPIALAPFAIRRALRDFDRPARLAAANAATIMTYSLVALIMGATLIVIRVFDL